MQQVRPLQDRVLVERQEEETKTTWRDWMT